MNGRRFNRRHFSFAALGAAVLTPLTGQRLWSAGLPSRNAASFGISPTAGPVANDRGMRAALDFAAANQGLRLMLEPGSYSFAVAQPWNIPAGLQLIGAGKRMTAFRRVDKSSHNWMVAKNSEGANHFAGFTAVGNGQSLVHGDGAFFFAEVDGAASGPMRAISFTDIELRNFRGAGWIFLLQSGRCQQDIVGFNIADDCSFVSLPGNARGPADIGVWAAAITIQGNLDPAARGRIRNVHIGAVHADIPHIKSLAILWAGVIDATIDHPVIARCGTIGIAPDSGAYAIMVGNETDGAPNPDRIQILGPTIGACLSVGVYFVRFGGIGGSCLFDGAGGTISNITDTRNATLPKGAVTATDGAVALVIRNVTAINCVSAVDIPLAGGASLRVDGVDARGVPANQNALRIGMQGGLPDKRTAQSIILRNIKVRATAPYVTGIKFIVDRNMGVVQLGGKIDIDVPYIGISAYSEKPGRRVNPFTRFDWQGSALFRNCRSGALVLRDLSSPLVIGATISILRGQAKGIRDSRLKLDNASNMTISGSITIDGVTATDQPAVSATGSRGLRIAAGALRFTNSVAANRIAPGSRLR